MTKFAQFIAIACLCISTLGCSTSVSRYCEALDDHVRRPGVAELLERWVDANVSGRKFSDYPGTEGDIPDEWAASGVLPKFDYRVLGITEGGTLRFIGPDNDHVIAVMLGRGSIRGVVVRTRNSDDFGVYIAEGARVSERVALFCPPKD